MDWTDRKALEALDKLTKLAQYEEPEAVPPSKRVVAALCNDLNTSEALKILEDLSKEGKIAELVSSARLLGIDLVNPVFAQERRTRDAYLRMQGIDELEEELQMARNDAMAQNPKDFTEVDRLKTRLVEIGLEVRMSKEGVSIEVPSNFDVSKLETLK